MPDPPAGQTVGRRSAPAPDTRLPPSAHTLSQHLSPNNPQPIATSDPATASFLAEPPGDSGSVSDSSTSSEAPYTGPPLATINSLTLALSPREHEALFWQSPAIQRAVQGSDKWAGVFLVVINCLYFRWQLKTHPFSPTIIIWCFVLFVGNLGQICWMVGAPDSYLRSRSRVLLICRLLRLGHASSLAYITRCAYHQGDLTWLVAALSRPLDPASPLARALGALRLIVVTTGTSLVLFHAAIVPPPFLLQLPLQLAYLALMLIWNFPISLHLLDRLSAKQGAAALCQVMNWTLDTMSQAYLGAGPGMRRMLQQCEQRPLDMVLLFVVLYLSFAVPVYIAYAIEYQQKQAYLEQLHRRPARQARNRAHRNLAGVTVVGAVLYQLLLLFLMGMQCWVVVLKTTKHLLWVVVPLGTVAGTAADAWPGAEQ